MIKITTKAVGDEEAKKAVSDNLVSKLKHRSEEEETAQFAAKLELPYIDTNIVPVSIDSLKLVDEADARKLGIAVIQKKAKILTVVSVDPMQADTQEFLKKMTERLGLKISLFVISPYNFERVLEKYKKIVFTEILDQLSLTIEDEELTDFQAALKNLVELKERIKEMPITEVMNTIMAGAYTLGASDVHIEPEEKDFRLRYRIDGVLQDVAFFPLNIHKRIATRIKMMSGMKLNLSDMAQDGTFDINLANKKIAIRASSIPGNYGESIVMRLLDPDSINVNIEQLGLQGLAYELVQKQIEAPNGMILTTGPTGSGKTTTLYAIISKLNTPDKKIITIEDPIEYQLKGVSQTQIEKARGYTFANGLRAIVRQDPDIILVGEIRDDETADIAVNSALTGHLVLSTFHTNSAIASIPRLIEMGVKPSFIAPAVNAIIGQRLVRKLCSCKEEYIPAKETIDSLKKILSIISPRAKVEIPKNIEKLYRPKGCLKCGGTGYKGRMGIFEVLTISPETEKMILDLAGETEITMAVLEEGMVTMLQDGILKAISGVTSIDEVKKVTGQGEFLEGIYEKLMAQTLGSTLPIKKEFYDQTRENVNDFAKMQTLLASTKIADVVKIIFSAAQILGVGDIHIEPEKEIVKIRFRIDGILQTVAELPLTEYTTFLGQIKMLSGVKTEARQGVIDSRFSITFDDELTELKEKSVDIRVSIILGGFGETVVMRLLSKSSVALDLDKLGIRKQNLEKIKHEVSKPNGVVLNTGPTGSGKTTTLYAILNMIKNPEIKIITVEDPIEYQMEGLLQTPVSEKDGYTFSTALRALLRQNPDIMMIGEIRDNETAQIAVQAALTGHLVLSTLHTNNASGAVARMLNMGVKPEDIVSGVNAFIAQRLVRTLCECKTKVPATEDEKFKMEKVLKTISPRAGVDIPEISEVHKPNGCDKCNHIGYKGRTTISEIFLFSREIQEAVMHGAVTSELNQKATSEGMITMAQDGILKVLEGETTLEEVERVTEI
ncbi:MAG: GspE/PulE family protein [Parcubacteria group bacterium]|jgi:type IV pilus assembly protein PilB